VTTSKNWKHQWAWWS